MLFQICKKLQNFELHEFFQSNNLRFSFYDFFDLFYENFHLGLIHSRHFEAQFFDTAIKRYCDKKIKRHLSSNFCFFLCELKIFISVYLNRFWNVTTIFWQKNVFLSFYCNIFLSQYCMQKYCVLIRPKLRTYVDFFSLQEKITFGNIAIAFLAYFSYPSFRLRWPTVKIWI